MIPSGRVYGAALNFRGALAALGDAVHGEPYKKPPEAPVLYLKPGNTWSSPGAIIAVPAGVPQLRMGGTLGLVFARTATTPVHESAASIFRTARIYGVARRDALQASLFWHPSNART